MGLFHPFRSKGEGPRKRYEDAVLGPMVWSEDDEAWAGEHGGLKYLLAYEGRATPGDELLGYARMVLADPQAFVRAVERAKADAAAENPWLADEIAELRVGVLYFSHQGTPGILAGLEGGKEGRSWRVEFGEEGCAGIGFDT